jgi:UDP-glucose 4-epimerase
MGSKPLVPGSEALFHFWPFPRGGDGPPIPDLDDGATGGGNGPEPHPVAEPASQPEPERRDDVPPPAAADSAGAEAHPEAAHGTVQTGGRERLLITGIAGGQGRLIARRLGDVFDVVGVDRVPWEGHPRHLRLHEIDLRKRKFEDVFRTERPRAVVHLAFLRHFGADPELRHEVNVLGTKHLLEYCAAYGVERLVVLSSAYVYGALPENPTYMTEDAALNISRTYPEVRDLAEVDTLCSAFLWRYPHIRTSILRPVNTLGYYVHSAVGRYLNLDYVPTILGFDPMWQFIHEEDVAEAVALAVETGAHGIFNVTGPGAVPLKVAIRESGGRPVPIPESVARIVLGNLFRLGLYPFPPGAIDFAKYSCTVDGSRFRAATGFTPQFTLRDIFASAQR